jgi:hypothetical protein
MTNEARKELEAENWTSDWGKIEMESWKEDEIGSGLWGVKINGRTTFHREWSRETATDKAWFVFTASKMLDNA